MAFIPRPHEIYKHFKGKLYQVTAVAEHTETGEQLVVYQAMYGDFKTYARPLAMFTGRVDREKYPDAAQEFRFELQGPDGERQRAESASAKDPQSVGAVQGAEAARGAGAVQGVRAGQGAETASGAGQSVGAVQGAETARGAGAAQSVRAAQSAEAQCVEAARGSEEDTEGELTLDPMIIEFLDADGYEQRLNILAGLHHRITDEMITTMAIACDVEVDDGDIEERYESLKSCLLTLERYECNRIR